MNKVFLTLISCLFLGQASAQSIDTIYFGAKWEKINSRNGAHFYRVTKKLDNGLYSIGDYYINGKLQMSGFKKDYAGVDGSTNEGQFVYYDSLGHVNEEGVYKAGKKTGTWKSYYDGSDKLYSVCEYVDGERNGAYTGYDSASGMVEFKGTLAKDAPQGLWEYYYSGTTRPKSKINFKDGKLNGTAEYYDSATGYPIKKGNYVLDKHEGEWSYYFEGTKQMRSKLNYKDDEIDGHAQYYDSASGKLHSEGNFEKGTRKGLWYFYEPTSGIVRTTEDYTNENDFVYTEYDTVTGKKPTYICKYRNRKEEGPFIVYYQGSDKVKIKGNFEGGLVDNKLYYYDSASQKVVKQSEFRKGAKTGTWYFYAVDGRLKSKENYSEDQLDGELVTYDSIGNKYAIYNFRGGKKHGNWKLNYYGTKQVWIDYNFMDDSLDGSLRTYYKNGKLKREETYNFGKLISSKCYSESGTEVQYFPVITNPKFESDVMTYVGNNLRYPEDAKEKGIEGKVLVKFWINESGTVSDAEVLQGLSKSCDEEAIRIVSQMPPWEPATIDGTPYSMYQTVPIVFWVH
ncbi:MAG: TonB family protein [Bacteroidetes bacterium]|nr:TonB family protein [Bacteroidota bacterium]